MTPPRLIAITDTTTLTPSALLARAELLLASAAPRSVLVQLRDPELAARARLELGRALGVLVRRHAQLLAINDRLDLARLLGADALHLGEGSISTAEARRVVGSLWISRACHDPALAGSLDADALLLSPVCASRKGAPALGISGLARAVQNGSGRAVYALGGVTANEVAPCFSAGAAGIAAIGAAWHAEPGPLLAALGCAR